MILIASIDNLEGLDTAGRPAASQIQIRGSIGIGVAMRRRSRPISPDDDLPSLGDLPGTFLGKKM
jgi:hypothetical protein